MTFDEWFKAYYIQNGFISSKDEAREIWEVATTVEREACAKVCEAKANGWKARLGHDISPEYVRIGGIAADQIAAEIRMRSNVEVQRRAECGEAACSESAGTQC